MKRYFIACVMIFSFCSFGYAEKRTKVTGFVFQEDTTGVKAPVAGLLVKLNRPGEENTTTSTGYFEIPTSVDGYVGEKIIFHIEKKGWVIKIPANGAYNIPKFSNIIKAEIVLVREGDKSLLNHAQILAFLYDEVARLSKAKAEDRDSEFSKLLTEYSKRLKIKEKDLQQAIAGWIKNVKTPEEKALAAFHRRDFDETISEANKILQESVNIRMLKANALLAKLDYEAAVVEYKIVIHDAPTHADAINFIGLILLDLAKYEEALSHYDRYLPVLKIRYGENSPEVATGINNLALVLKEQGDYAGALEKHNEALKIDEAYFGRNHPNVAREFNNIALVLDAKGDYAGALEKYNEALKIDEAYFGRNHPDVAIDLNNIAVVLESKGDYAGALEKFNEALKIDEAYFGRNHPNVAIRLNNIAGVLYAQKKYEDALRLFSEALQIRKSYFGNDHPDIAVTLWWIAKVLSATGENLKSVEYYEQAFDIFNRFLGPDHSNTKTVAASRLRLLNQIGVGYTKQSKADSALLFLRQALPIAERLKEQEMLGNLYNDLGSAHKLKQEWPQARHWLEKSLSHNRALAGDSAAVLAHTYFHLAGVAQAEGQTPLSREYAQKSLALAERHKLADLMKEVEALLKQKR